MKKYIGIAIALMTAACAVLPPKPVPPSPGPPPPAVTWLVDAVACADAGAVPFACAHPIAGATIQMHVQDGYRSEPGDGAGYAVFALPAGFNDSDVIIDAPGYVTARAHIDVAGTHDSPRHNIIVLASAHVDPSGIPLEQLAAIRGAMWPKGMTACGPVPLGPRPGQPDNIIATGFITDYDPATQDCIIAQMKAWNYTHVVIGPLVDSDGYHGIWPPNDWRGANFDRFLDALQKFWDNGLTPVVFGSPDNWTLQQNKDAFTALLQQPRAQRLIRIFVPHGWEPERYGSSSCTWAGYGQWARETLPNALILYHTVTDVDAPVGTDAVCDDNGHPNAEGWARSVPFFHGWLTQSGAFDNPTGTGGDREHPELTNFQNWARTFDPSVRGSYRDRFEHGYAGWPTGSAWGVNQPLLIYAGEYSAYWKFWAGRSEAEGVTWGDAAMRSGAAGYLDSGSVPVPVKR
jgi:hypothetical protein